MGAAASRPGRDWPTTTFAEFQTLQVANPRTQSRGRGELAALEILNAAVPQDPGLEAILLFEDSDIKTRRFVRADAGARRPAFDRRFSL
jgi:hypothetical protein